jgi:hypothetical protein
VFLYTLTIWFKNREQGLATSFSVISLRMGSILPELIGPQVYLSEMSEPGNDQAGSLAWAQAVGLFISMAGVAAGSAFNVIDKYNEDRLAEQKHQNDISQQSMMNLDHSTTFMPQLDLTLVDSSTLGHKIQAPKKVQKISFTELGASFIPFAIIVIFVYSTFLPYNSNLNLMLRTRFGFDAVTAGKIIVR